MILFAVWLYVYETISIWRRGIGWVAIFWPIAAYFGLIDLAEKELQKSFKPEGKKL